MVIRKNERGGALLLVLMLVVIFSVLGMGVLMMNISASKQLSKKEEQIQARHLAEMGIMHYKAEVEKIVTQVVINNDSNIDNLRAKIKVIKEITVGNYNVKWTDDNYDDTKKELNVNIISVGESKSGLTKKEVKATIVIETPIGSANVIGGGGKQDPPTVATAEIIDGKYTIPKGGYRPKKKDFYIKGDLDAVNGNKGTHLTVNNDLYIGGDIIINNQSCIMVSGNLTLLGEIPKNMSGKVFIVVYGNAYFQKAPGKINNGGIFVLGKSTSGDFGELSGYDISFPSKSSCPNIVDPPQIGKIKWKVNPNVNPEYTS